MSKETRLIMWNEFDFTPGRLDRSPIAEHLGRSDQPWLDGKLTPSRGSLRHNI